MELSELGKKFIQVLAPNGLLTTILIGLKNYFNADINPIDIVVFNILFGLAYVSLWHELRLREFENR